MVNFARFMKYGEKYEEKAQVVLSEVFGTKLSEAGDRGNRLVVGSLWRWTTRVRRRCRSRW